MRLFLTNMKKVLVILLATVALNAAAQSSNPFKLCGSVGFAQPAQAGINGGFLLAIEPKVMINPKLDIGVLVEAIYVPRSIKFQGTTYPTNVQVTGSYKAIANYWLSSGKVKSFVGLGAGLYQLPATTNVTVVYNQSPDDIVFPAGGRFGGVVRYGIKYAHLVATAELNAVLASDLYRSVTLVKGNNSYASVKIGYEIGGMKREKPAK